MKSGSEYFFSGMILLALLARIPAVAQISPGELSKVHAHLEGLSNCTKCHILGKKVSSQKCLECHTEIKIRVDQNKGYHASPEIRGKECVACHSDHHGLNFQIVRFAKEKFSHNLTGFSLLGAHAKKQCTDCHKPAFIKDPKIKKKQFTYLGLNPKCLDCHADRHQQTLSANCTDCHDFEAFKPAVKFNHANAKFQLTGRHREVACISCHKTGKKNGQEFQEFTGLKFQNCSGCHKDVHENKFGQNCAGCHTEQSFGIIRGVQNFDHDKTGFRLEGRHQKVSCNGCHKNKFTAALQYTHCTDCHTDYHKNQFARNGVTPDCSACHTVAGFSEFTFTIAQHNEGNFRLKGGHLATPCVACHKKESGKTDTAWQFREIGKRCNDCHQDIHRTFISEKYYPGSNCETCHNESRWGSVNFDHKTTDFLLAGAHAKRACRDCHFKNDIAGIVRQQFAGLPAGCASCHADVHSGQFEVSGLTNCDRCHDQAGFNPATKFDHAKTRFPLDGKHKAVACNKCHKTTEMNGISFILYKIKDFKCESCHH